MCVRPFLVCISPDMRSVNLGRIPAASLYCPRTAALQSPCDWLWSLTTDTPHSLLRPAELCVLSPVSVWWALAAWRRGEELRWHSDPVLAPASHWSPGHSAALWLVRAQLIPGQRPARDRFSGSELLCERWVGAGGMWIVFLDWESCFMLTPNRISCY